jgi:hypothetical protein
LRLVRELPLVECPLLLGLGNIAFGWASGIGMHRILAVLLVALTLSWPAGPASAGPDRTSPPAAPWRHTSDGWERAEWLVGHTDVGQPVLHPAVVGTLLLLLALAALIGLSPEEGTRNETPKTIDRGDKLEKSSC